MVIIQTHTHTHWHSSCVAVLLWLDRLTAAVFYSGKCDLGEKKAPYTISSPELLLLFLCAYEQTLILPSSRHMCVCVCLCDAATRAEQWALLSALQSISRTHIHTSYPRWRSSSQCHFQFGWAHGLFRRYNGLDEGREMDDAAQVSCNKHSDFWSSHSLGAIFQSSDLTIFHNCMHFKSLKLWDKYPQVGTTVKKMVFLLVMKAA